MNILDVPVPDVYKQSRDFRFFLKWFDLCLSKVQQDVEQGMDLYDPLRCPSDLLWMLCDTEGYKYDDRLCTAYNRLVLMYFASLIRNRGSEFGMLLAAETNLAQFVVKQTAEEHEEETGDDILFYRLEDTSIPVNSAYITNHVEDGYIDVVYFSTQVPVDACLEYVRPVGMYCFQNAGVRFDSKTKVSVEPKLVEMMGDATVAGRNRVASYTRGDYASLQKMSGGSPSEVRQLAYKSNSGYEQNRSVDAGYRALFSLQLCNGPHVTKALVGKMFSFGYDAEPGDKEITTHGTSQDATDIDENNLVYNKNKDDTIIIPTGTVLDEIIGSANEPYRPRVAPNMGQVGQAIFTSPTNEQYIDVTKPAADQIVDTDDDFPPVP